MSAPASEAETCWTMIGKASRGEQDAREAFARTYWPVVHGYLSARWRNATLRNELDDAIQEVFLDCFKSHGALERFERDRGGGFRAFLFGVVRNVALRVEREAHYLAPALDSDDLSGDESVLHGESPSRLFDRAWAHSILQATADRLEKRASELGPEAVRRVELLRLRFHEGLPIRQIAERWNADPDVLHHEYARARREFKSALQAEVAFHLPGSADAVERECERLIQLLG